MTRRELFGTLTGAVAIASASTGGSAPQSGDEWPFPVGAQRHQWTRIKAAGFDSPAPAYIFDGAALASGVPLGGLGTGYLTVEGDGRIGHSSIFNDLVPPARVFADWLTVKTGSRMMPLSSARIAYWGHYPVADLQAEFDEAPLRMGLRAFSPFIVGDAAASNTPAALFELELRNGSSEALPVTLLLNFPEASPRNSLALRGGGVTERNAAKSQYAIETSVPAGSARRVRFAVGWHVPSWRDSGSELRKNRYIQRFPDAGAAAEFALHHHDELLRRVLAWQSAIYSAGLPDWLGDALVQGLYSLAKNSVWIARTRKDEWWSENGWFTHSESHTGCPIVETMVCRMHGHFPLLFFFPDLEETTLEAFRHFQISNGEVPFAFGMPTSMRDPRYECQHPLNSGQYAQMVYRLYLRTGDKKQLLHFYDSVKSAIRYQYTLDDDGCGLVHDQPHVREGEDWPANQFYDIWPWQGTSSYVAGTWLATLAAGRAVAEAAGDPEFAAECADRLGRARKAFEDRLWNGAYYRLWNDVQSGTKSDVCLANQLMAHWCTRILGLEDVLSRDHVRSALDTIERLNMKATAYGLINGMSPDGKPYEYGLRLKGDHSRNIFIGEDLCSAMAFLYEDRRDTGLEIARRMYEAMAVKTRAPWNQRCLINGETGLPEWGDDYYSNLAIWAVPMALRGESIRQFAGGLPLKMIEAARA